MSPEQVRNSRAVDARADIWAFGVILFELLTGKPPFSAQTVNHVLVQILEQEPLRLRALSPDLPEALETIIMRCLAKEAAERFGDVAQLAEALGPFSPPQARVRIERIRRVTTNRPYTSSYPPAKVSELADTEVDTGAAPSRSKSGFVRRVGIAGRFVFALVTAAAVCIAVYAATKHRQEPQAQRVSSTIPSIAPLGTGVSQETPVSHDAGISPHSVTSASPFAAPSAAAAAKRVRPQVRPGPTRDPFDTPR